MNLKEKKILFVIFLYNVTMLFYLNIGSIITFILTTLFILILLSTHLNKWGLSRTLSFLMCIFVPTSFVSVMGTSYGQFPLSWFHLITILLIITGFYNGIKKSYFIFSPIFMTIFGLLTLFTTSLLTDALKQFLTIVIFLFSFFIGEHLSKFANEDYLKQLKEYYLIGVVSFSFTVIIQKALSEFFIFVGYQTIYGEGRQVFGGVMSDYSFATLYIATGAIIILIGYFKSENKNSILTLVTMLFLIFAMLIVNSRTGLVALGLTSFIYLLRISFKGHKYAILLIVIFSAMVPFILKVVQNNRAGQSLLDGSGRIEILKGTLDNLFYNPFFGVGFGLENLYLETGLHVPHNVIAQYLLQFGVVGSFIFFINFLVFFYKYFNISDAYSWTIIATLIGAMFIPDIVSSRFLSVLIIFCILSYSLENKKYQIESEIKIK